VVLTAGTFLDGKIHVGLNNYSGGRAGDPPAVSLSARLKELKLPQGRLKTGTPPRIDGRSIDLAMMEEQPGDLDPVPVFSSWATPPCTRADAVLDHPHQQPHPRHHPWRPGPQPHVHRRDRRRGPALLPVHRRQDPPLRRKESHQIFLEPEGLTTHEFYPNGISTSLPFDVQLELVRSMKGMENAHILRPGYAIEYDYFDPRGLKASLETKPSRACSSPARSTAPPVTKKPPPGPAGRHQRRLQTQGRKPGPRAATRPIWACWWTT
jgi:tRNA uridine 5-carboxymethylaminomethyl modification enzyme